MEGKMFLQSKQLNEQYKLQHEQQTAARKVIYFERKREGF
jgi:hypothetical protein